MTRVAPLGLVSATLKSLGMMRQVKSKFPTWLVANCVSIPSSLSMRSGRFITAALFTRMSMVGTSFQVRTFAAASRTDFWLERSSSRHLSSTFGKLTLSASILPWILVGLRPATMRWDGDCVALLRHQLVLNVLMPGLTTYKCLHG